MTEKKFASYYPICYRLLFAAMITVFVTESVGYLAGIIEPSSIRRAAYVQCTDLR
jgi:hypothetical protein